MSTDITPDMFLASLKKWGVPFRFYTDRADWLTHNRNAQQGNGPYRGSVKHNTASTSQTGMLAYLYRGDGPTSSKPGPLCQVAIPKVGEVVLIGWGTCTHAGPGDEKVEAVARKDALPLDRELTPSTNGASSSSLTTPINPHYLADESMHAAEGPTDHQRRMAVLVHCAWLDVLGGPANGYGPGSVLMHRELTTSRSDPQGWGRGEFRRAVAAQLKAGPPQPPVVAQPPAPAPVPLIPVSTTLTLDRPAITYGETVQVSAATTPAVEGVLVFQRLDTVTGAWKTWANKATEDGKATVTARPGANTQYRVGFDPADPKYRNGNYSKGGATVVVVDLTRLLHEHKRLIERVTALETPAAPPEPEPV